MEKIIEVEVTVPEGLQAGDKFMVEVALPKKQSKARGQLAGLSLEEMTDEQLKRELINSKSVLFKAKQRAASPESIAKNQARVDAAMAEKAKRTGVEPDPETPALDGEFEEVDGVEVESTYDEVAGSEEI